MTVHSHAVASNCEYKQRWPKMSREFLIFLDFDGVLHSVNASPPEQFDPICIQNANQIVAGLDAKVVISSAWRMEDDDPLMEKLNAWLNQSVVGQTPVHLYKAGNTHIRYREVMEYLETHGKRDALWLAIDDKAGHFPASVPLYRTDSETGLTDRDSENVIRMGLAMIWAACKAIPQT